MSLTIITFTIVAYSIQIFTTTTHTYAQDPSAFHNKILQSKNCNTFAPIAMELFCRRLTDADKTGYKSEGLLSFEQDLQSPLK